MPLRSVIACLALALSPWLVACEPAQDDAIDVAAAAPTVISGRYHVKGVTSTPGSPEKRKIEGTVRLQQDGEHYSATYELKTTWPAEGGSTDADVVGVGEGVVDGGKLEGDARTQLVISSVPGVDTGFAFVPRMTTARIVSSSRATIQPDGSIEIEIENRGAEGEDYEPTRTRLFGSRVDGSAPSAPSSLEVIVE
jgi:hypothetical protein